MTLPRIWKESNLTVSVNDTRRDMGKSAAAAVAEQLLLLAEEQQQINMIFAAAPSQNELLEELSGMKGLPWEKVNAFHMDEYVGLSRSAPQSFGNFLDGHIFSKLPFRSVHHIHGDCSDTEGECGRYSRFLRDFPPDIVCLGVGENGHIAFNDPAVADFYDPALVKRVKLDSMCRMQQVHDGCFPALQDVPEFALTLTIPALTGAGALFCVVPGAAKAAAVKAMLQGEINESCPASILRLHPCAFLYLERESASLL